MVAPAPGFVSRTLDSLVGVFSPRRAVARAAARATLARVRELQAGYRAARDDRGKSAGRVGSVNKDLLDDLDKLRNKSRELVRDDAHAAAAVRVKVDNVIGAGMKVQADVRPEEVGWTQQQADDWNGRAEEVWAHWSTNHCDANECLDFHGMTELLYRTWQLDGEGLGHRLVIPGRDIATSFELIDPERLELGHQESGRDIRGGVEIGERGQPVAYWISPHHPDDLWTVPDIGTNEPVRVARTLAGVPNVLHVFRRMRPGQVRGEPMIVPALPLFEHLHHYLDSEIIAARVNANFAVFVERPIDPASDPNIIEEVESGTGGGVSRWHEEVEPGTIEYLNEGEKISSFGHNRPGTTFDPFVTRVLRAIAASLGLPYEMIVKDYGGMNYSSARVALLEARRGFECEQAILIAQWLRPVWQMVIREAIAAGLMPQQPRDALRNPIPFLRARWIRPAWGMVDPVKEAESARVKIENNLSTPEAEAAAAGMDLGEVLRSKARGHVLARRLEEANDLPPGTLTSSPGAAAPPKPAAEEKSDDDPQPSADEGDDEPNDETEQ